MHALTHHVDNYILAAVDRIPNAPLFVAGFTIPVWLPSLLQISHVAGILTPIILMMLAALKGYDEVSRRLADWRERRATPGYRPSRTFKIVGAIAAAAGVLALVAYFTASSAKASPAAPPVASASRTAGRRKQDDDDEEDDKPDELAGKSKLYDMAMSFLGTKEALPNGKANPDVRAMFVAVKGWKDEDGKITADPRKVPWCAVFVNYCLYKLNVPGTNNAMARSFHNWGKRTYEPKCGDVVTFWRGEYDNGEEGHVAIFVRFEGNYVVHIGGNQSNAVTIAKTHKSRVLQYRRNMSLWESKQMWGVVAKGTAAAGTAGVAANEAMSDATPATGKASETIEAVRSPISQLSEYLPGRWQTYALLACTLLGLVGVFVVWYERRRYRQEIGW